MEWELLLAKEALRFLERLRMVSGGGKICRIGVHRREVLPSKSAQELHRLSFVCGPPEAVNRRNPLWDKVVGRTGFEPA